MCERNRSTNHEVPTTTGGSLSSCITEMSDENSGSGGAPAGGAGKSLILWAAS